MNLFITRVTRACALAAALLPLAAALPAYANELKDAENRIEQAKQAARAKAQSGQKTYSVQSTGNFDALLRDMLGSVNSAVNCINSNAALKQRLGGEISSLQPIMADLKEVQNDPALKALAAGPLTPLLETYLPKVKQVLKTCQDYIAASAGGGGAAAGGKYEQVSAVMKQVFRGGDLAPGSRAVKHAADVDMPARGGNPEALRTYLNSQNGTVKRWYQQNFGLQ